MSINMRFAACFILLMIGMAVTLFGREVLDVKREIIVKFDDTVIVIPPEIQSSDKDAIAMRNDPRGDVLYSSNLTDI